jgi:DMSO/TMAO reductase YedYZ molybdopterin-dependent catalytic subunit
MALFQGKPTPNDGRIPPGQYRERGFPVLSYGPTPEIDTTEWKLEIDGLVEKPLTFTWDELLAMPQAEWTTDIHCVTRWSKLDTVWRGVWLDDLLARGGGAKSNATHLLASCYGGYTTNVPLAELVNKQSMIAHTFDGKPLPAEHGGPARLLVPHLYFWKSAKWVNQLTLLDHDEPGFWEVNGYHMHGDPWTEERYS